MTQKDKRRFVEDLAKTVIDDVLSSLDKMPKEWDGHELRVYLAWKFNEQIPGSMIEGSSRRADCDNEIETRNL